MNFFSDVKQDNTGSFEMGGGDIAPIPEGTQVLAAAEEAKNSEYDGDRYINIKWRIAQPAEYANRVIFQKVKCYDIDTAKAQKGKQMLFAIATNSGGKLFQAMQSASENEPSDTSLARLTGAPMVLKLGVWDYNGKTGNWVQAVSARKGATPAPAPMQQTVAPATDFDDIPF